MLEVQPLLYFGSEIYSSTRSFEVATCIFGKIIVYGAKSISVVEKVIFINFSN